MIAQLSALILDDGKWPAAAMGLALLAITFLLYRHRHAGLPARRRVLAAMNLFIGVTIATVLNAWLAVTLMAGTSQPATCRASSPQHCLPPAFSPGSGLGDCKRGGRD